MTFPLLFVGYHLVVAVAVAILLLRFLTARQSVVALTILAGWLAYAAVLGASGTVGRYDHVPGLLLLVGPIILALLALALSQAGGLLAARVPLALLLGFQVFRVGVELSLHHLWSLGTPAPDSVHIYAPMTARLTSGNNAPLQPSR